MRESVHVIEGPTEIRIYCANRLVAVIYTEKADVWVDERCDFIVKKLSESLVREDEIRD